jgi:hypothetical protein
MPASTRSVSRFATRTARRIGSGSPGNQVLSFIQAELHLPRAAPGRDALRPHARCIASLAHTRTAPLHRRSVGHNNEVVPDSPPETDFGRMDVLSATPVPSTSVDVCMSDGFALNSGVKILGGDGAMLVGGQAFAWRPWDPKTRRLVNDKGQWEVPEESFALFGLLWPRPGM